MDIDYTAIGERLAQARKSMHITQTQAGALAGVGKSYIANIEKGRKPSLEYVLTIASKANVSLDWLLIGEQTSCNQFDETTKDMLSLFNGIPNEAKPYVLGMIKTLIQNSSTIPKETTSSTSKQNDKNDASNIA